MFASPVFSQQWGNLSMTFFFDSTDVPVRKPVEVTGDPLCMPENLKPLSEALLVDPQTRGIENVVFFLDSKLSSLETVQIHPDLREPARSTIELSIRDCVYSPHVFLLRVGQKLSLFNADRYGHNPNFLFFNNDLESRLQPPDYTIELSPKLSEKAPTPIRCNLHPWMQAYAVVLDHPYVGISDRQGRLEIKNLPVGKELTFRIWHESLVGQLSSLTIRGEKWALTQNRLRLKISQGENDFGRIPLPPTGFLK
jgi:hypothetical protein